MANPTQESRRHQLARTADPRAERTRRRIIDGLDSLLRSGETVSVALTCARAGVARSTFYTHFATVDDVALSIVDDLLGDIGSRDAGRRTAQAMPRSSITRIALEEFFAAFHARRRFFRYALSAGAGGRIRQRILEDMSSAIRTTILIEKPDATEDFARTAGDFIAGGSLGVLIRSLDEPSARQDDGLLDAVVDLLPPWLTAGDGTAAGAGVPGSGDASRQDGKDPRDR